MTGVKIATDSIHFYAPGLKRYRTSEYSCQDHDAFVSVSVTGSACALQCDHCESKVLHGMLDLETKSLFDVCQGLADKGTRGILISGGCDAKGRVPLGRHFEDMARVRNELGMMIRVHSGLVTEETAQALGQIDIDGAMVDVIGAEDTVKNVYHLDVGVGEYERTLERLHRHGVPTIPHIVMGLHYGEFLGEYEALDMVAKYPPKLLVLVNIMALYGTAMAKVTPPPVEEIDKFFQATRQRLPDVPIMLGCARPFGDVKATIDRLAVDAGLNGIAYPADGIVDYAVEKGLSPQFHDACCGINW
ncbi:MAG: radical SAM protein [Gemmatimonadota bacterium]|nr:radical SAM protein [Gemmatimonadota bacterium]